MHPPLLYSLGICVVSAVLEGLFAGRGIKQRLAELRVPRFAPPLWTWIVIGLGYYAICFAVLFRLFSQEKTGLRDAALVLLGVMMFINAAWNWFFFRSRNLRHAFAIGLPYGLVALALFAVLLRLDAVAAWWLLPYLVYLLYASVWSYRIMQLNP